MNRKILFITIIVASFFLVFLGMRNPYLSGGSGPKQRPRATAENTIKNHSEIIQQHNIEFAYLPPAVNFNPNWCMSRLASAPIIFPLSFIALAILSARAPPEFLS